MKSPITDSLYTWSATTELGKKEYKRESEEKDGGVEEKREGVEEKPRIGWRL